MASQERGNAQTENAPNPPKPPVRPIHEPPHASPTKDQRDNNSSDSDNDVDKAMVRWTKAVAAFTFCLFIAAILQFCAMRGQQNVMQGQLDEMQVEQRPWIKVTIQIASPIIFMKEKTATPTDTADFAYIPLDTELTNVGHSPAFNASIFLDSYVLYKGHNDPNAGEVTECATYQNSVSRNKTAGYVLFPGEAWNKLDQAFTRSAIGVLPKNMKAAIADGDGGISIFVIGCVDYVFGNPARHHETGFVYQIWQVTPRPGMESAISSDIVPVGQILPSQIILIPSPDSNNAN